MLKNLLLILMAAVMVWSCGNQQTEQKDQTVEEEVVVADEKPVALSLAEFNEKAETLVGKEVILEGTVIHVCEHGGQKMFITADDPDVRIKITTTDETAAFIPELEGSDIKVVGIVEEIEAEVVGEGKNAEEGEEVHEEDAEHEDYYHKPQYSLKCIKYAVVENTPEEK
jgi:hypothetical protein